METQQQMRTCFAGGNEERTMEGGGGRMEGKCKECAQWV